MVPERAPVEPHIISPETGDSLPLVDEVLAWMVTGRTGVFEIVGDCGAGKTMALGHLAAVLPPTPQIAILDDPSPEEIHDQAATRRVVYAAPLPSRQAAVTCRLAPWGEDECIEYLLTLHPQTCGSVIGRLRATTDRERIGGTPELWAAIIEELAADSTLTSIRDALRRAVERRAVVGWTHDTLSQQCVNSLAVDKPWTESALMQWQLKGPDSPLWRLVRHDMVRLLFATDGLLNLLRGRNEYGFLAKKLPLQLVNDVGEAIAGNPLVLERLRQAVAAGPVVAHAMAASLLHAARTGWRPERGFLEAVVAKGTPRLAGAFLNHVVWEQVDLAGAFLDGAELGFANLSGALLDGASAVGVYLAGASLRQASLFQFNARRANLARADLSGAKADKASFQEADLQGANLIRASLKRANFKAADLREARLAGANLSDAVLVGAQIGEADFSTTVLESADLSGLTLCGARFDGADFAGAKLVRCNLEDMELVRPRFEVADLTEALLSGSRMRGARFAHAVLRRTGLADIDWEGADLREADLRGATFHMGSTRSGMLITPVASLGTRTGFYTDDYEEQGFKAPEEIRKASLKGADLRGARIDDVDFYLVDLRGAHYTPDQEEHFRRCRAIL